MRLHADGEDFHIARKEDLTAVCRNENTFATLDFLSAHFALSAHACEANEAVLDLEFDRICKVWFV